MAQPQLIRISVHPYVRKYCLHHYSEPFFVTERGYIPGYIENALERMPKVDPADYKKKDKIIYGEFLGVYITPATIRKRGNFISSDNVKLFNDVVSDLLHEEMYRFINQLNKFNCQVDDSIRNFQAMYDFTEDELPFENLKRWYYRERKRLEDRKQERQAVQPQYTLNFFAEIEPEPEANPLLGAQMSLLNFGG